MIYWIWLAEQIGYGSLKAKALIDIFGSAREVYVSDENKLSSLGFLTSSEITKLKQKSLVKAKKIIDQCNSSNIGIVTFDDLRFPERLKEISNPPMCLYYKGEFFDFDNMPCVCLVGQREVSEYGKLAAWSLSARLTLGGITVISGGAKGTDAAAHKGALDVGGKTVAFLACGINYSYLKANQDLREQISKNGCLISEFSPNTGVLRNSFSIRNRLMSGITLGTVVVEAPKTSGALITAKHAYEQSRDVFVITSKPDDPNYAGNNALLRDGAKPVFDADDIFNEYYSTFSNIINKENAKKVNLSKLYQKQSQNTVSQVSKTKNTKKVKKNIVEGLSKNAKIVYNFINMDIFTVDDLSGCEISFDDILVSLTELELFGYIKAIPGGRYSIKE
ncbi:MAG: DNA-processing protein DprA [Clostridia bacterium]|nr:DNA-processing protein DprA [Clostridia bacterium]